MRSHNLILSLCVVVLAVMCIMSVYSPIRFRREVAAREHVVMQRMNQIGVAEERYRQRHGAYTADFAQLTAEGLLADSLQYIPFSNGKRFELEANMELTKTGRQMPQWNCSAPYEAYLQGLDKSQVATLTEEACAAGRYPGMNSASLVISDK